MGGGGAGSVGSAVDSGAGPSVWLGSGPGDSGSSVGDGVDVGVSGWVGAGVSGVLVGCLVQPLELGGIGSLRPCALAVLVSIRLPVASGSGESPSDGVGGVLWVGLPAGTGV